jgi:putative ABC transport system substrate-binding protein
MRHFIAMTLRLLAALTLGLLPSALHAQIRDKGHRIAVISPSTSSIEQIRSLVLPELARLGFAEGRNLTVTSHVGLPTRMAELAREALGARPDVVVASTTIAIQAVKAVSSSVPIVMCFGGEDPVADGLARSLNRPGGNVTGLVVLATELDGKRVSLLHEAVPTAGRIAVLARRPPSHVAQVGEMQRVAVGLGLEAQVFYADEPADYAAAFAGMRAASVAALALVSAPWPETAILSQHAIVAGLPTVCSGAYMVRDGCLLGYAPNLIALRRRAADYVARILSGTAPGELPIEQPAVFEFTVNIKTANALGITIPPSIMVRADEVIE